MGVFYVSWDVLIDASGMKTAHKPLAPRPVIVECSPVIFFCIEATTPISVATG